MKQKQIQKTNDKNDQKLKKTIETSDIQTKNNLNSKENDEQTENDKYELKKLKFYFIIKLLTIIFAFLLAVVLYLGFLLTNKLDLDTLLEFEWPLLLLMGITTTTLLPSKISKTTKI
ncbi:hypothetical protein [Spiroplasma endosymbiont of Amphimallon solstitiale]|uniref:hypothetical protein n=1 Tax=Spiroplasma endosymbiont of Amphimallon solstitiale TaxID=3066288 RepID=UPI00313DF84C